MRMEFRFTLNYIKPKEKRVRKAAAGRLFLYDAERKQDFLKKERPGKIKFDLPFIIGKI